MSVFTSSSSFSSSSTSEGTSPLVAGMVSYNGLVPLFGVTGSVGTSEVERGVMIVPNLNDWIARLNKTSFRTSGPTGSWATEWWAVNNYLLYGGSCIIGGTGSTGDYYRSNGILGITQTPLHNKALTSVDIIFDSGNTFSAGAAVNAAINRKDCMAVVGNYKKITGIPLSQNYTNRLGDFAVNENSEYVMYVAGRKKFTAGAATTVNIRESNLSPDIAGCFARCARDANIWSSPAGKNRGRILSVITLDQQFSETDSEYLINSDVNPVMVYPGEGTFLMGNQTAYDGENSALNKININSMVIYLKKQLLAAARNVLFEINDERTRQTLVSTVSPILEKIKTGNGIQNYRIVCDETNNPQTIVSQNKLVLDVYVQPSYTAEYLVITIINSDTSEAFTG